MQHNIKQTTTHRNRTEGTMVLNNQPIVSKTKVQHNSYTHTIVSKTKVQHNFCTHTVILSSRSQSWWFIYVLPIAVTKPQIPHQRTICADNARCRIDGSISLPLHVWLSLISLWYLPSHPPSTSGLHYVWWRAPTTIRSWFYNKQSYWWSLLQHWEGGVIEGICERILKDVREDFSLLTNWGPWNLFRTATTEEKLFAEC